MLWLSFSMTRMLVHAGDSMVSHWKSMGLSIEGEFVTLLFIIFVRNAFHALMLSNSQVDYQTLPL